MRVKGVGEITREEAVRFFDRETQAELLQELETGETTEAEIAHTYKYNLVRKCSKVGDFWKTWEECIKWLPESVIDSDLTPEQIAEIVDNFSKCYIAGKKSRDVE